MYRSTTKWTTTIAAAALIALPLTASAQQTTPPSQPQQAQPPAQPPTQPTQPPAEPTAQPAQTAPAAGQLDPAAAKAHLGAARDTLSQLTSLPEAAKLQGEARTQVSQVIANFNELITTQTEWRAVYAKVDANITALLGPGAPGAPASGVTGAVGTSGTTGATPAAAPATELDPAVRAKLVEFRKHLKEFEKAAGGPDAAAPMSASANPAASAAPPAAATGTSGMTQPPAAHSGDHQMKAAGHSEADKHLDAISAILEKSKAGALTAAQTTELKKHVAELRTILKQGR